MFIITIVKCYSQLHMFRESLLSYNIWPAGCITKEHCLSSMDDTICNFGTTFVTIVVEFVTILGLVII